MRVNVANVYHYDVHFFHEYGIKLVHCPQLFIEIHKYSFLRELIHFCSCKVIPFYSKPKWSHCMKPPQLFWVPKPHVGWILEVMQGSGLGVSHVSHILQGGRLSHVCVYGAAGFEVYFWGVAQWPHTQC